MTWIRCHETLSFSRSVDQLEHDIIQLTQILDRTEYRLLDHVREFDIRQCYLLWSLNNTAEWLSLKCGIAPATAREKVRVAMAIFDKPLWSKAFEQGELSYSKLKAMTRVKEADEQVLLDYALERTVAQVEKYCDRLRNGARAQSTMDANQAHAQRWLSCRDEGGDMVHLSAELPREVGLLVMKAIQLAAESLESDGNGAEHSTGKSEFFARQADALVLMAKHYLHGEGDPTVPRHSTADRYQVVVHVDESVLRDQGGKSDLPVETVRRLLCDGSVVALLEDGEDHPLNVGRRQQIVPTPLARALAARDGCCRFPGCSNTRWLGRTTTSSTGQTTARPASGT